MTTTSATRPEITSGSNPFARGAMLDGKQIERWPAQNPTNELSLAPLRWNKPRHVILTGDPFADFVPDEFIDRMFAVMALCPQHTFQVLTKRPERMRDYLERIDREFHGSPDNLNARFGELFIEFTGNTEAAADFENEVDWPLPNVWLGTSVEDQAAADARIPLLLDTPAAKRFLSCEPLLGAVDLRWIAEPDDEKDGVIDALLGCNWIDGMGRGEHFQPVRPGHEGRQMQRWVCSTEADILACRKIDWVIAGGESGPGARPMHPDWARSLRDQCAAAGVPFFMKQMTKKAPIPTDLLVRETPE